MRSHMTIDDSDRMPNSQSSHHPSEGGTRSLTETLLLTTTAANTRADEATLMFGGVAAAVDEATRRATAPNIPRHLMKTYQDFLTRLQSVALEFFESHVRGYPHPLQSKKNGRPKEIPARSWPLKLTRPQVQAKPTQVDERLFLRLSRDSNIRLLSPYPLLSLFRKLLGEHVALLKEVQHVSSGLALRPSLEAAPSKLESLLSEFVSQGKIGGTTGVEKAQNLVSYVITSVPRNYTTLNDYNQLTIEPIGSDLVKKELSDEKGDSPVAVFETRGSSESSHMHTARYIARLPLGTTLPLAVISGTMKESARGSNAAAFVVRQSTLGRITNRAAHSLTLVLLDACTAIDPTPLMLQNAPYDLDAMDQDSPRSRPPRLAAHRQQQD
ncbi:hypothetical protein K3495_g6433 [Podosphaera aphanis]|nr:hypothetical protein K3495_g6433 [Podosphaera aphanis]